MLALASCLSLLSSCATFDQNDVAARLNDDSLSTTQLTDIVRSDLYASVLQSGIVNGLVNGDAARSLLTGWLKLHQLEASGVFKDVDRAAVGATLQQSNAETWAAAPEELRDLLVMNEAAAQLATSGALNVATALQPLATAEVYIDPRYGRWDAASSSVVPLSS